MGGRILGAAHLSRSENHCWGRIFPEGGSTGRGGHRTLSLFYLFLQHYMIARDVRTRAQVWETRSGVCRHSLCGGSLGELVSMYDVVGSSGCGILAEAPPFVLLCMYNMCNVTIMHTCIHVWRYMYGQRWWYACLMLHTLIHQ